MFRNRFVAAFVAAVMIGFCAPSHAADHQIRMLNRGEAGSMVFEPSALKIAPGDTVTFVSTDPSHNAETIPGLLPEGAESFRTPVSKDTTITFTVPGVYGVKCTPHFAMGMVAVIQVGDDAANIESLKSAKLPPLAKRRLSAAYESLGF